MEKSSKQFSHKISLGQNFLTNPRVGELCISSGEITGKDVILEIGPGQGALTRLLLESGAAFVHAIEIDTRLAEWLAPLETEFRQKFRLTWCDALASDLAALSPHPNKVMANIPYNITSELIWKILSELAPHGLDRLILLVQKEAADRLAAPPCTKERCPLGITIELMGGLKTLMKVSPGSFSPPPKVWSSLIMIETKRNASLAQNAEWRAMLKSAFSQRRKKLMNNMMKNGCPREILAETFAENGIREDARAEELTCGQWLALYDAVRDLRA